MSDLKNQELGAIVDDLEAKMSPRIKGFYQKLVVAGQKVVLNKGAEGILYALGRREDVVLTAVRGAINLVGILKGITQGTKPPPEAMIPASFTLLMYALEFADQAKLIELDQRLIGEATRLWMNNIMHGFGLTPGQVQAMTTSVDNVTKDPAKMDVIERYVGTVKDPRIAKRTLPDEGMTAVGEEEVSDGI